MVKTGDATSGSGPGTTEPGDVEAGGVSRFVRWRAGWGSALRLARRDIAKHRGRSLLIVLLVGLPVLLICAGATAFATNDVNHAESIPREMGSSQALVAPVDLDGVRGQRVQQDPYGSQDGWATGGPATREPGVAKDAPWTTKRVQHLTGGTVLSTATTALQAQLDDRHIDVHALLVDGRQAVTAGMTSLTSGRWPRADDEVLVTAAGAAKGLPTSGTLTLDPDGGASVSVTVVGVGTAWLTYSDHAELVALPSAATAWNTSTDRRAFLVADRDPVAWPEVQQLNAHGLVVDSRQVFEHPGQAQHDPENVAVSNDDSVMAGIAALIVVGILLETMLLAGPAFAVSASRQRRSLALLASNGAGRAQIRRYVLAQAVLLGVLAAVVGAAIGVAAGIAGMRWWGSTRWAVNAPGPVDIPVWEVLGVAACAAGASLVAAYVPARGAGRLDLVGVLRGHSITGRPVRRGQPVLGVVLAGVGGVILAMSIASRGHEAEITMGAVVLVAGALLLIPWLLSVVGRLGRRLPLPIRMATRDLGRQRGRSAPAVAAIMTAVTALTALAIANTSDQAQAAHDYQPSTVMGQGLLSGGGPGWPDDETAVVHREAPGLEVMPIGRVGITNWLDPGATESRAKARKATVVRLQRTTCADGSMPSARGNAVVVDGFGPVGKCTAFGSDGSGGGTTVRTSIGVIEPDVARKRLGLTGSQIRVLTDGGMLVAVGSHAVHDKRVTVLTGSSRFDAYGDPVGRLHPGEVHRLPAATVDVATLDRFGLAGSTGALVTPATAAEQDWPTYTEGLSLRDPGGTISKDAEQEISQHLPESAYLDVERGYEGHLVILYLILFGIFGTLMLVATLISTALAQAESRADLGTLAAVGATKRLRRLIAGSQALVVALVGSVLGLVVGFVPGIALTWPLTAQTTGSYDASTGITITSAADAALPGPVIDIPWLALGIVVIGVPLLAALVAGAAIRKSPRMTRRAG